MGKLSLILLLAVFGSLKESKNSIQGLFAEAKKSDLTRNLKYYEILSAVDLTHHIVKRGVNPSNHPMNHIKELQFKTLGR
jgi:hypothetical protein